MFKPRPYDPNREDKQTDAQKRATERNFRIFRLHGLHSAMFLLTGPRRELAQMLVDQELQAMGARTTLEAQSAKTRKLMRKRERERAKRPEGCTGDAWCMCDACCQIPF